MSSIDKELQAEAQAFDDRINERLEEGFIPDLRRAQNTDYFYKSFWRDPQFIQLYLGEQVTNFLDILNTHCGSGLRILDIGCGAGYMSLELARNGYHMTALDISSECIHIANRMLEENPYTDGFGSLQYKVMSFEDIDKLTDKFDVIHFSVALHHMMNVDEVVQKCFHFLPENGHIFVHEPCHERFLNKDAAQVALIRGILAITGHWYEPDCFDDMLTDVAKLNEYINDTRIEYFRERDKDEPDGQSPNDLEASGAEMLESMRKRFVEVEYRKSASFIYRLLGGIRGDNKVIRKLADFISTYDKTAVKYGYIHENFFYFLGKKISNPAK